MAEISAESQQVDGLHEVGRILKLIDACGKGSGRSQQEARRTLESIGAPAVKALIDALLHSNNSTIRWRAAEALGHIGDRSAAKA